MNKTIKVLEKRQKYLKQRIDLGNWGIGREKLSLKKEYKTELNALSTAIQALKALDQAEKVLPEKTTGHRYDNGSNSAGYCNGRNQTIEDFKPIIAHKDLRIGFLELTNRAINKELQSLTKENEVLREQNLDAVKDYKELQSLKSKLSRENLENVIDTEGLGIHFEEMGNSIGVYQALRKQLVQAIQKACGINDGGGE